MQFDALNLRPELLRAIQDQGYTNPTQVQKQTIPKILDGRDVIAVAQTGTGKTAAFTLPMLQNLLAMAPVDGFVKKVPRALILTPTRELAQQVFDNVVGYSKHVPIETVVLYGGVKYDPQIEKLHSGVDIIVATPGRLRDHVEQGNVDLSQVKILVLDEADRMLDMGFIEEVQIIIEKTPKERQTLLFSATFSDEIKEMARNFLHIPSVIHATPENMTAQRVEHVIHPVDAERKFELLIHLIHLYDEHQMLIFTRTKKRADELAAEITARGFFCMAIHSDRTQAYRTKALASFKDGRIQILVGTDIAARGLDIDSLNFVLNYEIPNLPEDYVHRIGRTGRAGAEGLAISLVTQAELYLLAPIEALIKMKLNQIWVDGFAPTNFDPRKLIAKEKKKTQGTPKKKVSQHKKELNAAAAKKNHRLASRPKKKANKKQR